MSIVKPLIVAGFLLVSASPAQAWWGNNGWGYNWNPWPVWTPMYWADEMFDNDDYYGGPWYGRTYPYGPYNYYQPYNYGRGYYGNSGYYPNYRYPMYGYRNTGYNGYAAPYFYR